jgi:hypothetical protein
MLILWICFMKSWNSLIKEWKDNVYASYNKLKNTWTNKFKKKNYEH